MKKGKILVTGGAGFIASHIVDAYINLGHKVVVIDDLSTGKRENINKKVTFYQADIRDREKIEEIFAKEKPQIVNHHAAIAEVVKSLRNPIPTLEVNVLGTVNVLRAGGEIGIEKFIFSSTGGAIYGEPDKIPANEKSPTTPLSPYGLSKLQGEEAIACYARHYGFDYLIFRYPNVFGPRQNPKGEAGVVAIFSGLMSEGKRPTIFGDGTKTRDYVYVKDIVSANVLALTKGANQIINLGIGKKISDQMIFDAIAKNLNLTIKPTYKPYRKGEVYQIALDAKKAKRLIGWNPTIDFEEGIKKYVKELYG